MTTTPTPDQQARANIELAKMEGWTKKDTGMWYRHNTLAVTLPPNYFSPAELWRVRELIGKLSESEYNQFDVEMFDALDCVEHWTEGESCKSFLLAPQTTLIICLLKAKGIEL